MAIDPSRATPEARERDLSELVFRCLERAAIEGVELDEVLAELGRERPELIDDVRASLDVLRSSGLLDESDQDRGLPDRLGDFDLHERIGGGGMGVVYVATQRAMGRRVALKLVRLDQLYSPEARARFRREVDAFSRLSHPGIVQVHTVGEDHGIPYIAMELVAGCSLDRLLRALARQSARRPRREQIRATIRAAMVLPEEGELDWDEEFWDGSWRDIALRIVRRVAEALEHAHGRGILHRDVKPSNVMVTPGGRVLLLDFGLASLRGGERMTRTGSMIGSLPYMAPEQIEEKPVDQRMDVYALGVTLYELLTLRSPYLDSDSTERTRLRILEGRPMPPRRIDPSLPADVQTVCLTAMDRDAERRYPSAGALATDVTHLLEGRPIAARPAGAWVHVSRWVRRRPGWATAIALALVTLTVGPSLFAWQRLQAAERLSAESDRTSRFFERASRAVDSFLTKVGDSDLRHVPQVEEVREELLDEAKQLYEEFVEDGEAGPEVRANLARAHYRTSVVDRQRGRAREADESLVEALRRVRELLDEDPSNLKLRWDEAVCLMDLGRVRTDSAPQQAIELYTQAAERFAVLEEEFPEGSRYPVALANSHLGIVIIHKRLGDYALAAELGLDVLARREEIFERFPQEPELEWGISKAAEVLGAVHEVRGHFDEAEQLFLYALEITRRRIDVSGNDFMPRHDAAFQLGHLGTLMTRTGRLEESAQYALETLEAYEELARDYPLLDLDESLFVSRTNVAVMHVNDKSWDEARRLLEGVHDIASRLHAEQGGYSWGFRLAVAHCNLADVLRVQGELPRAEGLLIEGAELLEALRDERPGDVVIPRWQLSQRLMLSELYLERRDFDAFLDVVATLTEIGAERLPEAQAAARQLARGAGKAAEAGDERRAEDMRAMALDALFAAVDEGFADAAELADEAWRALCVEPEFQELVTSLQDRR